MRQFSARVPRRACKLMRWCMSCDQRESCKGDQREPPKHSEAGCGLTEEEIGVVEGLDHE